MEADVALTPEEIARRQVAAGEEAGPATTDAALQPGGPGGGRGAMFAREAARKLVHVTTATVGAGLAWVLPDLQRRALFLAVAAIALTFDLARLALPTLHRHFQRALEPMLRGSESRRITGATTLALGFMAAVVIFPRIPAISGLLYAGLGDAAGALVGRAFGRHRYPGGKSLEGSLAFLVVAFAIGCFVPGLGPAAALLVAVGLTIIEAFSLPFDDNLLLPIAGAALAFLAMRVS